MQKIKSRLVALSAAVSLGLAVGGAAVVRANQPNLQAELSAGSSAQVQAAPLPATACRRQSAANTAGQDILLSTASPRTYTGTAWQNVDCTSSSFRLKYNERAVVVADVSAEADCNGTVTSGQWCQARALLNGAEGAPVAAEPSSFAFDAVAGGSLNWQAHSFNRGWEVRCTSTAGCQYKFVVQTRMHDASVTGLWLDEVAAHIRVTVGNPAPL